MVRLTGKTVSLVRSRTSEELELMLVRLTNDGMSPKEIAAHLNVPHDTVYGWVRKLGINRNTSDAQRLAWEKGHFSREAASAAAYERGLNTSRKGRGCKWKGQELPQEWRDNISQSMTGKRVGENHPMWKGGEYSCYGHGWKPAKRQALRRADGKCESCQTPRSQLSESLHVHHKIPVRCFEQVADAHALDNLIVLCRPCHNKAEREATNVLPLWLASINGR